MPDAPRKKRRPTQKPRELADFARALGRLVAESRETRGLSQEAAADAGRLDIRQWQRIERGEINITLAVLLRVAQGLGVPPRSLIPDGVWGAPLSEDAG